MLKKIASLVKGQGHLVLATCGPGGPHASLMTFAAAEETPGQGGEFWLATEVDTRKYANLRATPLASLLLDDRAGQAQGAGAPSLALTVTASWTPFESTGRQSLARQALLARHPGLAVFLAEPGVQLLRLVPLRYQLLSGLTEIFLHDPLKNP